MEIMKYVLIVLMVVYFALFLFFAAKTKKMLRNLLLWVLAGIGIFTALNLTSVYTGVYIPVNIWTLSGSAAFGVPGILAMLAIRMFF